MDRAQNRRRDRAGAVVVATLLVAVVALGGTTTPTESAAALAPPRLRDLADAAGVTIGSAVAGSPTLEDAAYLAALEQHFNRGTAENAMKWSAIHPAEGTYDFTDADAIVATLEADGAAVRGHTLAWHTQNPSWLTDGTWSEAQATALLEDHISTVVGRYAGRIDQWDVVNEAVFNGQGWPNPWTESIGYPDYLDVAFAAARAADPTAALYYNDFLIGAPGPRFDEVLALVDGLLERGVPIDGVGSQSHIGPIVADGSTSADGWNVCPTATVCANRFLTNAMALDQRGLDFAITELDVALELPASAAQLAHQAEVYRGMLQGCLLAPNCDTVVLWGVDDGHSWLPSFIPGHGAGLILDSGYVPKPAHDALMEELAAPPTPPSCGDHPSPAAAQVAFDAGILGAPLLDPTGDGWACLDVTFPDVPPPSPFFDDVEWAAALGVVGGYADGTYRPTAPVSRQALVAMLCRLSCPPGWLPPDVATFPDVPIDHRFFSEVEWAAADSIVGGYADGTFHPTAAGSRQALVAILWRLAGSPTGPFPDPGLSDVGASHPFRTAIAWAASEGLVTGYADGTFGPARPVSRQAAAAILHRADVLGLFAAP